MVCAGLPGGGLDVVLWVRADVTCVATVNGVGGFEASESVEALMFEVGFGESSTEMAVLGANCVDAS